MKLREVLLTITNLIWKCVVNSMEIGPQFDQNLLVTGH